MIMEIKPSTLRHIQEVKQKRDYYLKNNNWKGIANTERALKHYKEKYNLEELI